MIVSISIPLHSFVEDVLISITMVSLFLLVSYLVFQLYMVFYTIEPCLYREYHIKIRMM